MRLAAARQHFEKEGIHTSESKLLKMLLRSFAWGELSAAQCQRLAAAVAADGCDDRALQTLAKAGSGGVYPGNVERDMKRHELLKDGPLSATTKKFDLPMNVKVGSVVKQVQAPAPRA